MDWLLSVILSIFLGLTPMAIYAFVITWFDRYEREPLWLMVGVFLWGAVVSAGSAFVINTLFGISLFAVTGSEVAASVGAAVISAPIAEETVKGAAVLAVYLYFRHELDSMMDGILYGSLVGFGFAATENINYIFSGFAEAGLSGALAITLVRAIGIAFLHAALTSCTGLGFAVLRLRRDAWRFAAPLAGYSLAILFHAAHNLLASLGSFFCLIGLIFDWLGFIALFAFILYLVWREGQVMREHLREEVLLGNISVQQYETACSLVGQFSARWGTLAGGSWQRTGQFYDTLGELAFKKYQLAQRGAHKEPHALATIARLRTEAAALGRGV